jgi:hypothetical protein
MEQLTDRKEITKLTQKSAIIMLPLLPSLVMKRTFNSLSVGQALVLKSSDVDTICSSLLPVDAS